MRKSGFMSFLDNIDNDIINETYVDDVVEEEIVEEVDVIDVPKRVAKNTKTKDSSVKLIEARIRTKLDDIGLNESAISEVVSFVLNDVQKVSNVKVQKSATTKQQPKPQQQPKQVQEQTTVMDHAGSLLEGLPDTPSMGPLPATGGGTLDESANMSDVADKASSLL